MLGIIGGSGLYEFEGLTHVRPVNIETPFGPPSDTLVTAQWQGLPVVFLPRHGRGHKLLPSEIPYRANIFALKTLGVRWLISVSAVGSMKEQHHPGDLVLPTQYLDRTYGRAQTFFGDGVVAHVSLADPSCSELHTILQQAARAISVKLHSGGTYVCIEGPGFSTRAESLAYRALDVEVIGMTAMPEVKLAREAEMHHATLALVTDYDCWKTDEAPVSAQAVVEILKQAITQVKRLVAASIPTFLEKRDLKCHCTVSLNNALMTAPEAIEPQKRELLEPLLARCLAKH